MAAYFEAWSKFAQFNGRSSRKEYWSFVLINTLIYVLLGLLSTSPNRAPANDRGTMIQGLFWLVIIVPSIAVQVRRLHDTDRTGWYALLMLIPCVGNLILFFWNLQAGDIDENQYGPDPYDSQGYAKNDYRMNPIEGPTRSTEITSVDAAIRQPAPNQIIPLEAKSVPEMNMPIRDEGGAFAQERRDAPRAQHYAFAHVYLRDKAFANPVITVNELSREKGNQYLKILWVTVGHRTKEPNDKLIEADGLECHPFEIGDSHHGVIVRFPEPMGPAEAYFVAIVIPNFAESGDESAARYITLERSAGRPDETTLAEWRESSHFNYGSGPPPDVGAFKEVVVSQFQS